MTPTQLILPTRHNTTPLQTQLPPTHNHPLLIICRALKTLSSKYCWSGSENIMTDGLKTEQREFTMGFTVNFVLIDDVLAEFPATSNAKSVTVQEICSHFQMNQPDARRLWDR